MKRKIIKIMTSTLLLTSVLTSAAFASTKEAAKNGQSNEKTNIVANAKTTTNKTTQVILKEHNDTWKSHITHSDVRLRADHNTHSTVKRLLQPGDPITVYGHDTISEDGYEWLYISYKGIYGYVPQDYLFG